MRRHRYWQAARRMESEALHGAERSLAQTGQLAERAVEHMRSEEPFWPAQLAAGAALLLYLSLPAKLVIGPNWLVPSVEGIFLAGLVVSTPTRHHGQSPARRAVVIALLVAVSLTTLVSLVLETHYLLQGGKADGRALILSGVVLWVTNVLIFAIWFWELDRGGPGKRLHHEPGAPDFLFPQMTEPELAPDWRPSFWDYFYTSYTNATAFSPTDTMPWSVRAKLLMAVQSSAALVTVGLVVARAVNILG